MKRLASLLSAVVLVLAVAPAALAAGKPTQTIVQIATANGNFKTLLAAVGCADPAIGKALTGKGPLTVSRHRAAGTAPQAPRRRHYIDAPAGSAPAGSASRVCYTAGSRSVGL